MQRLLAEATSRSEYFGEAAVAIDTTAADLFTGDREGREDEIIGAKEDDDEYAYQWATIQVVDWDPRVMLDARPVRKGNALVEIVTDLLESAEDLIRIDRVLMDGLGLLSFVEEWAEQQDCELVALSSGLQREDAPILRGAC